MSVPPPSRPPRKVSTLSSTTSSASIKRVLRKSSTTFSLATPWSKDPFCSLEEGLAHCYKKILRPIEKSSGFQDFHSATTMEEADFCAKPQIMIIGQYSTGKSTMIQYLLETEYPGIRIGPEPTTDRFNVIMYSDKPGKHLKGIVPGNALVIDNKYQYKPLSKFGNAFLNRLQCCLTDSKHLEGFTLIDTPGVLSGEKQSADRGYDYVKVLEWFAARVDRIIVLFDANKLDISDELRNSLRALREYDEKIRIVLNKADAVNKQQLMRVYGALMWSLGRVFNSPEVVRIYIGSFWDGELTHAAFRDLFKEEENDLYSDLCELPRQAALRKLNDFIKRARAVKIHALILTEIKKKMPAVIGKKKKKMELLQKLDNIYEKYDVSAGDFPNVSFMREQLRKSDWDKYQSVDLVQLKTMDKLLREDVSKLMEKVPVVNEDENVGFLSHLVDNSVSKGNSAPDAAPTPFRETRGESLEDEYEWEIKHQSGDCWIVAEHPEYKNWLKDYDELKNSREDKVLGMVCKEHMLKNSNLPEGTLRKIWRLSDVDRDGNLTEREFCLAKYLIDRQVKKKPLPKQLPDFLVP